MKCTNPIKCDGEMSTYAGIQAGKIECVKCGYRTDAPKETPKPKATDKTIESNKETK